jgi:DNA processing protein
MLQRWTRRAIVAALEEDPDSHNDPDSAIVFLRQQKPTQPRTRHWAGMRPTQASKVVGYLDPDYPAVLKAIPDPPLVLEMLGNTSLLARPNVAVVGARRCTRVGAEIAERFARELGAAGVVITSGLALGIDGAAHRGALASPTGTIACLGSGIAQIYPTSHARLAEQIGAAEGLVISEYAATVSPRPYHFPERNRLISGLSNGVLLVEAGEKSGSLITARLALEQGREVFAIPGPINNPTSRGCHRLIRQGAELVSDSGQILESLGIEPISTPTAPIHGLSGEQAYLVKLVSGFAVQFDQLVELTGWPEDLLFVELSQLELTGIVRQASDGYIATSLL